MTTDKSILRRMEEQGRKAPRVHLKGTERDASSTERYEILGELARGATGIVHKGRDNDVGRDVALKVLLEKHLQTPELVQRFVEEAQIGGQLQHPGIVPVYELGLRDDQRPYFAMKLVKGETLAARLAARKDPADGRRELLAVFREVCRTMAYAHARGVIHRDLKPSNVMIGNFGEVQVVDWGFAKVLRKGGLADEGLADKVVRASTMISTVRSEEASATSVAGSVMGTPAYMPPEQALGRVDDLDEQSDLFSLGAILCEILTGTAAYAGTAEDRMTAATQALLEPAHTRLDAGDADARLVALCKRCLQAVPKDRPPSAQVLADEVATFLTDAEGRAHRAHVRALEAESQAEAQRRARRLTKLIGSSVVSVLLITIGAWLWIDAGRTERERNRQNAIETALREASRLRAAKQWSEALAAAQRAITLGDDGALARTIENEAAAATLREQLERDDAALLAELEEIRARYGEEYDARSTDADYVATIERRWPDFAVDVERLRDTVHAPDFAAVFDAWAHLRRTSKQLRQKETDWRKIDGLARAIDPRHNGLRDALVSEDPSDLVQRAASDEVLAMPPALLATIGATLHGSGHEKEATDLLDRAQRKYPGDSWIHHRLGRAAYLRGEFELALRHYTVTLALRPGSMEARHRVGMALEQLGDLEGALGAWRAALRLQPDWTHGMSHVAAVLTKQGKLAEAEAMHRKVADLDPRNHNNLSFLGSLLNDRLGRPDEAIEYFEKAIRLEKKSYYYSNLSVALSSKGNVAGALRAAQQSLALAKNDADAGNAHARIGAVLLGSGKPAAAIRELEKGIQLVARRDASRRSAGRLEQAPSGGQGTAHHYFNLGEARRRVFDLDGAARAFHEAIRLDPRLIESYTQLAEIQLTKGDTKGAIETSRRAIAISKDSPYAYTQLGRALSRDGHHEDAIRQFDRALALDAEHAPTLEALAIAQRRNGDTKSALETLEKAIGLHPNRPIARVYRGTTFQLMGEFEKALRAYDRAIQIDESLVPAWANKVGALQSLGRPRDAIKAFKKALERDPVLPYGFAWAQVGKALAALGRDQQAIAAFARAVEIRPGNSRFRINLGALLSSNGQSAAAIPHLREAIRLEPGFALAHANLAIAFLRCHRLREALDAYYEAVKREPRFAAKRPLLARLAQFEKRLPEILAGKVELTSWDEVFTAAELAVHDRKGALRLFRRGFEMNPAIAKDLTRRLRYKAACTAVLAGTESHGQALAWLQADLEAWQEVVETDPETVAKALAEWKRDPALASVRDVDELPERFAELWTDVDALLKRVR